MVGTLLSVMMIAPALAAVAWLVWREPRAVERFNLIGSIVVFVIAVPLAIVSATGPYRYWGDYIILDMPGAWVILCTSVVYLLASIYAVGYMRLLNEEQDKLWNFYALFAGFALTVLFSTIMNSAGIYWIAIELTTLVSTFLVG